MTHYVGRGLAAHKQGQRVDQNGLACASLTGQQVQPRTECSDRVIDNSVVFGSQFEQHIVSSVVFAQHSRGVAIQALVRRAFLHFLL
jgi:hypothetical protein